MKTTPLELTPERRGNSLHTALRMQNSTTYAETLCFYTLIFKRFYDLRYCCLKTGLGARFGAIFDRFSGGPGPKSPRKCDFSPTDNSVNNDKYEKYPSRTHAGTSGNEIATALRMRN